MKLNKLLTVVAFAASFGLAAPVSAAVVQVQYTGTVSSGYDQTGIFGTAGSYLDGLAYTANYTFETTNGYFNSDWFYNHAYGGSAYGNLSPALGSSVTINGNTVAISGNYFGQIYGHNAGYFSEVYHLAQDYVSNGFDWQQAYSQNYVYNYSNTLPLSLTDPLSHAVTAGDYAYGYLEIRDYNYSSNSYSVYTNAYFTPDHVTIGAPIPEPETYALLLAGLGLLGFAARRRKIKEVAAA